MPEDVFVDVQHGGGGLALAAAEGHLRPGAVWTRRCLTGWAWRRCWAWGWRSGRRLQHWRRWRRGRGCFEVRCWRRQVLQGRRGWGDLGLALSSGMEGFPAVHTGSLLTMSSIRLCSLEQSCKLILHAVSQS